MPPQDRYTYQHAGFNSFMLRSLKSNPAATTARTGIAAGPGKPIAFDRQAVAGAIGDKLKLGRLILDGPAGRIVFLDKSGTVETGWAGDLTD